ncbi:hypothetical protein SSP35_05_04400 [Streptomyces sp. NBRC 110611]|uniref:hypothetical protein n=1 Tax=Streptomyces sp. NBRC 110611 TaxID=1621259 RepID=UPI0008323D10|nr:hypothetical protein [Streptomyces sp. NBRC 110611]GAU67873.1 hypothetical protein SSP35_05_04400 [Streptomyces sp. NBRC 110611]
MAIARPQTRQFESFTTNMEYARQLITAGQSLHGLQPGALDIGDLYRAAWVQAVSAVDHWLHEELFRRVAELAAASGARLPVQLQKYQLPLSVIEEVRAGQVTLTDAVLERVRSEWATRPLHNPKEIARAYRLVTDDNLWSKAAVQLNEWFQYRTHYDADALKEKFSAVVARRNKIAHESDLEEGHLKRRRPITDADACDAVDWIERITLAIATVLD